MTEVQTRGHPDVFMIMDFVSPDRKRSYSEYACGYMDRDEAIQKRIHRDYADYIDGYMDNPIKRKDGGKERRSGLFNATIDSFSEKQIRVTKRIFDEAQQNESPLWRPILSFKNSFLAEYGIYEPKSGWVDDARLRDLTRRCVAALLKNEGMQNSAVWAASIHYNTDNIHIHIAIVEPHPTRDKIRYRGKLQYRSRLKPDTLRKIKSQMAHCIVDHADEMKRLQTLTRDTIIKHREPDVFLSDDALRKKFLELYHTLPADRRKWKYNMNALKRQRPMIDALTSAYIERYHAADYQELLDALDRNGEVYRQLYGEGKMQAYRDFKENKIKDLYTRMGNAILTELRKYDSALRDGQAKSIRSASPKSLSPQTVTKKTAAPIVRRRITHAMARGAALQRAMASLRKAIGDDSSHWKAQLAYKKMIEQSTEPSAQSDEPAL